jgi:outer membrane lipoprotein-sorting protein
LINKIFPVLLILLLTFISGCTEKQTDTPGNQTAPSENVTISHKTYGAFTLPEMQLQELSVNSTSVVFTTSDSEGNFKKTYEKPFNETAFKALINLFEETQFLQMEDRYVPQEGQPVVTDVGTLEISLKEGNITKTVTVDPYYSEYMPEGLQKIDSALVELRAYALSTSPEEAEKIAEAWIENAPTYSFDGFDLKLADHEVIETFPEQHTLKYTFTSRHGGYGNRTDQIVSEALTPHSMEIIVSEGEVKSAVIDDEWNEITQQLLEKEPDADGNSTGVGGNLVEMKYPVSEEKTPWDQWYGEGNIQFIKAPTQAELINAYYGNVYGIEIFDTQTVEDCDPGYPCSEYYIVKIKESDSAQLRDLGWEAFEEN